MNPAAGRFRSPCGSGAELAYYDWRGPEGAAAIFCVHGLSRNKKDFRSLAAAVAGEFRVVCPDVVGRGESEWLGDKRGYTYPNYAADLIGLIEHLGIGPVAWVGTSMGGILGMMVASARPDLVQRLVLNDVGADVDSAGVKRILGYVGKRHRFDSKQDAMAYIREILAPFGVTSEDEWEALYDATFVEKNGGVEFAYDPAIVSPAPGAVPAPLNYWDEWSRIACPVLILRGADSDLLSRATVLRMCERKGTRSVEIAGCGHAPALLKAAQIGLVVQYLREACTDGWDV